jgi:hypothetical protein
MSAPAVAAEYAPFEYAPPYRFLSWLGLIRGGDPQVVRRALISVAICWVPLAVLTVLHGDFLRPDHANAFALDFAAHARFLITAPLLILAESLCAPRLAAIVRHFRASGIVPETDGPAYDRAVDSTRRLLRSRRVEILAFVVAYALVAGLTMGGASLGGVPLWHGTLAGHHPAPTPAGWWGLLVSLPLLLVLQLGWLWRVGLWARFLWLMSRMTLRLVPSHPDHAAGLKFVGYSLEAFVPLAFACGVLTAGLVLNQVVHHGASPAQFRYLALGVAAFAVVLFGSPTLVFVRRLIQEHHRGVLAYGAFANRAGCEFEHKWLAEPVDEQTLRAPDFAPTNSLYAITGHAFAMSRLPFDTRSVAALAGAALLPFVPIALLAVPVDVLLGKLRGILI